MLAYYGSRISEHMTDTPEGYLICHDVPINRTGTQDYLAHELNLDGEPNRVVKVNRYEADVFSPATLASFEGKDITNGHPPESVNAENHAEYSMGHVQNVRRHGNTTIADLIIKNRQLIEDIKNNIVREVSCGYLCNYEQDGDSYKQTNIRGNHVAVVPQGRAGHDIAIKDAANAEKGQTTMNKFVTAILTSFGMAAKEAKDETEVKNLVECAATALDAMPVGEAKEPASDVMVEREPKGDDLGTKLDKVIEMLGEVLKKEEKKETEPEDEMDKMIEELGSAKVIEEDKPCMDSATVNFLLKMRPVVAGIKDRDERARVADAVISAVSNKNVDGIVKTANDSARANAKTSKTSYEKMCADSENAYAERNPHKNGGVK